MTHNSTQSSNTFSKALGKIGFSPIGFVLVVLGIFAAAFIENEFYLRLLTTVLMYGALAMAFDFTAGYIGIVNFGFAAFWGLGAYTTGALSFHLGLSPWLGLCASVLMAALLGLMLGLLTIRLGGIFAACMTWFVAMALMTVALNWVSITRGATGLPVRLLFYSDSNAPYLWAMAAILLMTYITLYKLVRSKAGLAFQAIGQDLESASISGINANFYKIMNFTISCAFAGLIGGFYAHFVGVLTPQGLHTRNTVEVMAIAYIGGRGSIWGGLAAALLIIPAMEHLKTVPALADMLELRMILYGTLMIVVMVFYPGGLCGIWNSFMQALGLEKWSRACR